MRNTDNVSFDVT